MPDIADDLCALMERVKAGSPEAEREFLQTYGPHVIRAVRRNLTKQLRSRFDSVDFVQEVWTSFFAQRSNLDTFDRSEALIAFLTTMASNKVADECRRRLQSIKNDISREQPFDSSFESENHGAVATPPTPSQFAMAQEQWEHLLSGEPELSQRMLVLRYEGYTYRQIARKLGVDEKAVRRVLEKLSHKQIT